MNGCELPGNVVLKVEPSDPLHKKQRTTPESNIPFQPDEGIVRQDQNINPGTSYKVVLPNSPENDHSGRTDQKQQLDHHQYEIRVGKGEKDNQIDAHDGPAEKEEDDLDGFFASLE
mmetsp:Transcript_57314/g.139788  ORF Transcript_57314/g.139788 Transcript_57314/m.139788 type:complete len:116 (+) Transcript_57314:1384-1731(+)